MKRILNPIFAAFLACLGIWASQSAFAAGAKKGGVSLATDMLAAKAVLEDVLNRRLTQELSTKIERNSFSLGAQIDLVAVPPATLATPKPQSDEPISDLMLGTIDPEALLKVSSAPTQEQTVRQFMDNFRIKSVAVSVGLSADLAPEAKTEVETWLAARLKSEFGSAAKGTVSQIHVPIKKKDKDETQVKTVWDWLNQFQSFAGQVVIAFAILLGIMLWQLLAKPAQEFSESYGDESYNSNKNGVDAAAQIAEDNAAYQRKLREEERKKDQEYAPDIEALKTRLSELVPKLVGNMEDVIRSWCRMGDPGKLRLACFAEVAGQYAGKLPIPVDALSDIQRIFSLMPEIELKEKKEALEKAYWDLLSAINLGSDSLEQPFSYLAGANIGSMSQVLMEQNPKLRAVVSLYMPTDLRERYLSSLPPESKKELLIAAAGLSEILSDELEALDRGLMNRIAPTRGKEIINLDMSLNKIVASLSRSEEITLLADMKGEAIEEFKRSVPTLAFLADWPDEKIQILLMGVRPDEVVSLLRVRTDLKERILGLCSPMTFEIANDELSKPDKSTATERNEAIGFLTERLRDLVQQKELNLEEIFGPRPNVTAIGSAGDGSKRVA